MKLPLFVFLLLPFLASHGQENVYFSIEPSGRKVAASLYNKIALLDTRDDNQIIGIIGPGSTAGETVKCIFQSPVEPQLKALVAVLTENPSGDGELLFQLRRFHFVEQYGVRFCYLSAILYARNDDRYVRLLSLDTTLLLTSRAKELQKLANGEINGFIRKGLTCKPQDTIKYSFHDIQVLDSSVRTRYPLYTSQAFVEGQYDNSNSFLNQQPDWQGVVVTKRDGSIMGVYPLNAKGKPLNEFKKCFALVYHGVPYIATSFGYFPAKRLDNEVYVDAYIRMFMEMWSYGITYVGDYGHQGRKEYYRLVLDPVAGRFIHLRPIRKEAGDN